MKLLVRQRDYEGREAAHALEEVAEVNDLAEGASRYCALLNSRAGGGGATSIVACTPAFRVGALASAETPVSLALFAESSLEGRSPHGTRSPPPPPLQQPQGRAIAVEQHPEGLGRSRERRALVDDHGTQA